MAYMFVTVLAPLFTFLASPLTVPADQLQPLAARSLLRLNPVELPRE